MKLPFNFNAGFVFDPPSGVYKSAKFSAELLRRAQQDGPTYARFGPVIFKCGLDDFVKTDTDAGKVLVYQLRALRQAFPGIEPELRVTVACDFGRERMVAWYDPRFEDVLIGENVTAPAIDPAEVL